MKKNLIKGFALTLVGAMAASFPAVAEPYEYITKEINAYDHNGNLVSSHLAPDVQYIEVVDARIPRENFTVNNNGLTASFAMIPVIGTESFQLKSSLIEWPMEERTARVKTFYIGETEVTNELWKAVTGTLPSSVNTDNNFPVTNVSWNQICNHTDGFLSQLNELLKDQLNGMEFCLPTEWEWEYAAGGGNLWEKYIYSGSNTFSDVAWEDNALHEVKGKAANGLGIYDMTGNVSEWCSTTYRYPESGEYSTTEKSTRGGNYLSTDLSLYIKNRGKNGAESSKPTIGLRLALKEKETTAETLSVPGVDGNKVELKMIPVAGARSYRLGSTLIKWDEEDRYSAIKPFFIGETEVTNALWKAVMGSLPGTVNTADNLPVANVSWEDICKEDGFLDRLNALMKDQLDGKKFYLPSEWEWEYAATGGNHNDKFRYSGSDILDEVAWHGDNSEGKPHEVKTLVPNSLGIYDMTGNVSEWCSTPYRDPETGEYIPDEKCTRGASWSIIQDADPITLYFNIRRSHQPLDVKYGTIGFRLILK